jgi:hypothetical protein
MPTLNNYGNLTLAGSVGMFGTVNNNGGSISITGSPAAGHWPSARLEIPRRFNSPPAAEPACNRR